MVIALMVWRAPVTGVRRLEAVHRRTSCLPFPTAAFASTLATDAPSALPIAYPDLRRRLPNQRGSSRASAADPTTIIVRAVGRVAPSPARSRACPATSTTRICPAECLRLRSGGEPVARPRYGASFRERKCLVVGF